MQKPYRRSVRLVGADYTSVGGYFVTICTKERECIFGSITNGSMTLSTRGEMVRECWQAIPTHFPFVVLSAFVIMPNHIHGIIVIKDESVGTQHAAPVNAEHPLSDAKPHVEAGSLGAIVRSFKSASTRQMNLLRDTPGAALWQRNYHEHIIRDADDKIRIHDYIMTNPERWIEDKLFMAQ
jgi:REP element-mobilizing transposase RayT